MLIMTDLTKSNETNIMRYTKNFSIPYLAKIQNNAKANLKQESKLQSKPFLALSLESLHISLLCATCRICNQFTIT